MGHRPHIVLMAFAFLLRIRPMDDIVSEARAHPPVDTNYVLGRWHKHALSTLGIRMEARVQISRMLRAHNTNVNKFLVIGRARSGTTLLTRLLNAHPDVTCDHELLSRRILSPVRFLDNLATKSTRRAYGCKLLSYQMVQVQRFDDPVRFLRQLEAAGFCFIHLRRDTFSQTLSLMIAQSTNRFHQRQDRADPASRQKEPQAPLTIDIEDFLRRLEWNALLLRYEDHCLSSIAHLPLSYEQDLMDVDTHQATADRVFDWIGVDSMPVQGNMRKMLSEDPSQTIANYAQLADTMAAHGLAHMLPQSAGA